MELHLQRDVFTLTTTLGILTVDGKSFGYVCEDEDRGLDQSMPLAEVQRLKVPKETAIPAGRYRVMRTWSNRFHEKTDDGKMMLVCDVPGFQGIRIHPGNTEVDTDGCLLPGTQRDVRKAFVGHSTPAWEWLDAEVMREEAAGREVWITIDREPIAWAKSPLHPK